MSDFNETLLFWTYVRKTLKFHENPSSRSRADPRGHTRRSFVMSLFAISRTPRKITTNKFTLAYLSSVFCGRYNSIKNTSYFWAKRFIVYKRRHPYTTKLLKYRRAARCNKCLVPLLNVSISSCNAHVTRGHREREAVPGFNGV